MILLLIVSIIVFTIPLFALRMGKEWLTALLPIYLITANVFAESFFTVFGLMTSLAIPVYAATFLITDILSEHYGKSAAQRAVWIGFMGQIIFLIVMLLVLNAHLFGIEIFADKIEGFSKVFQILPRLIVGSFVAYLISQFLDVTIFHRIREEKPGYRFLWLRNNVSTWIAQGIDTIIFISIAFGFTDVFSWSFILTTWIIKIIVAIIDTPFVYFSYNVIGAKKSSNENFSK